MNWYSATYYIHGAKNKELCFFDHYFFSYLKINFTFVFPNARAILLSDGVTGNTSDFGSEESRFEP